MTQRITPARRRLVLGAAFAVAMLAWMVAGTSVVRAAGHTDAPFRVAQADSRPAGKSTTAKDAAKADTQPKDAVAGDAGESADTEITIDRRGVIVDRSKKRVRVGALGHDREYESFEDFVQDAPWLAGLVFLVVLLVFLVPLLIIVLLVWYKIRKNRMLNETMIKLAEKGVMPPAEALGALTADRVAPAMTTGPATAPLYEQAKVIRQRAAASDLRKGVILIAVGLGFCAYSMFADGEPNWIGLVLLFLGIGYCVLWFFEDRPAEGRRAGVTPPAGGAPPPGGV